MRGEIVKYPLKNIIFFVIAILIFVQSSFDLTDNEFKIEETSNAVSDLLDQKNTNVSYFSFYYTDSRLYSLDYNVNWRIQIWQDVINDSLKEKQFYLEMDISRFYLLWIIPKGKDVMAQTKMFTIL